MRSRFLLILALVVALASATSTPALPVADDDGFALSIQATGDFTGNFEPCGCRIPVGGLARRVGYAKEVAAVASGKAAILQVDAGRLFAPENSKAHVSIDNSKIKNEWTLRAADAAAIRAANVAIYDLPFLTTMMATSGYEARAAQYPILERFVSANVVPASSDVRPFKPYVVEEVTAERLGAKPLRVGIIGVTEMPKSGDRVGGYRVLDPAASLRKYAAELRAKSDVVVVLAYMEKFGLQIVEPAVPGVDVVVAAHQFPPNKFSGEAQRPAFLFAANQAKGVDEARFYPAPAGAATRFARMTIRHVALDKGIPSEPEALALTKEAIKAFRKLPE